jgi:photosystem II stability/assembly factor-like uncharacterized protein
MSITGVSVPDAGALTPIWVPDPSNAKRFRMIGRSVAAPDMPSATVSFYEKHGYLPRSLFRTCEFTAYDVAGVCQDLSDMYNGVTDYMTIFSRGKVSSKNMGDRVSFTGDDPSTDELTVQFSEVYPVGPMGFGDNALTLIDREVLDVAYGKREVCGSCGVENDGSQWIYAVTRSSGGSPGLPSEVVYSIDGGATWSQVTIPGIGAAEDPTNIDFVGSRLIVMTPTAGGATTGGYYWADVDPDTGIPGTWTKVTSGFVAAAQPRDMFVLTPREVFICGDGGYIYKAVDITSGVTVLNAGAATVQNLARIRGSDDVLVAAGASGTVIKSTNRGSQWAAVATAPTTSALQALAVFDNKRYWVGSINGYIWYTLDGGKSWTTKGFSGAGAGQVFDIVFATAEIGYMLFGNTTPTAKLVITLDGGMNWQVTGTTGWRVVGWPTFNYGKRIAVPESSDPAVNANNIAVAGITSTNDGVLLLGKAQRM